MAKIPMIWTGPATRYGGRYVSPGQEFMAHEADVRVLHATKRADFAPALVEDVVAEVVRAAPKEVVYVPEVVAVAEVIEPVPAVEAEAAPVEVVEVVAEVQADPVEVVEQEPAPIAQEPEPAQVEEQSADEISPRTGKAKRPYRRKDMTAEGSGD